MAWLSSFDWTWPALMLAFLCGVQLALWFSARRRKGVQRKISEDYFKGLNFLLNEELFLNEILYHELFQLLRNI